MATYREISFQVLDQFKLSSDDTYFEIQHIVWLIDKYKALLLRKYYVETGKQLPDYLLHTICLDLETTDDCVKGTTVKSKYPIPKLVSFFGEYDIKIFPVDDFSSVKEWTYINRDRFTFVGTNKWLKNIIYFTVFNNYLYLKSASTGYENLKKVSIKGLFENPQDLFEKDGEEYMYQCNDTDEKDACLDPLDMEVGVEDFMIPALLESIIRDLTPDIYRPQDTINNAKDNLSGLQGGNPDRGYNQQNPVAVNQYGQPGRTG